MPGTKSLFVGGGSGYCSFSSSSKKREDPFRVLGVPRGSPYKVVKEAFLKLALEHHPDRIQQQPREGAEPSNNATSKLRQPEDAFIRIRQAFEVSREGADGQAEAQPSSHPSTC